MRSSTGWPIGLLVLLLSGSPAYAYIDPASGSLMLQVLLGGVFAFFVLLKLYWHKLLRLLRLKKPEEPSGK